MLLDDIGAYLQTKGFGIVNNNILLGELPDTKKVGNQEINIENVIAIFETGGFKPEIACAVEYPTFQVIARGTSYTATRQKIQDIYKSLHGEHTMFMLIQALQSPVPIGQDEKKRWEFSVNFKVIKQM